MNEEKRAISSILETQALGLEVAKNKGHYDSMLMHLENIKEFVGKGKKAGLDNNIITKYENIIKRSTN